MAGQYAIAAVGKAILAILAAAAPKPEFAGAAFELYQSRNIQSPMEEGVALYLYRVNPSGSRTPQARFRSGKKFLPSITIDLHYLLIAWARDAFKQQRLLGWAMRTLEDTRVLNASVLNQYGPETSTFDDTETLDVLLETISIQDLGTIWDTAKPQMQPCATYIVRMVTIDSAVEMTEPELAQTRVFDMATAVER
jgi:hypothetical protein